MASAIRVGDAEISSKNQCEPEIQGGMEVSVVVETESKAQKSPLSGEEGPGAVGIELEGRRKWFWGRRCC